MAVTDARTGETSVGWPSTPPRAARAGAPAPGIQALYGVLALVVVGYAISLIVRGPNGASPAWLDGWGTAGFELIAALLVLARAYASPART